MSVIASMVAVLKADVGPFANGMKTAQGTLNSFANSAAKTGAIATAMGGAISASVGYAANRFSEFGDAVAKMAARTGLSTEAVSSLRFAADQSATSIEAIEKAIKRLSLNVANGSKVFAQYGISLEQLKASTPEQQFNIVAEAIRNIQDPTIKLAAAQQLLGKSGAELIPLFADGAAGLEAYKAQAQQLGLIIGGEAAASAEILNDKMGALKLQMDAAWVAIGQQLAPALIQLIGNVQSFLPPLIEWIGNNSQLVLSVAAIGAGLIAFGTVMLTLSATISGVSTVITVATAAISGLQIAYAIGAGIIALGQAFVVYASGLGIAQAAMIAARAAFVALASSTGIGLIIVAIGSAVGYFAFFTDAGKALVSWIYDKAVAAFKYLGSWVQWLLEKIGLASGEMKELAGQELPQGPQQPAPQGPGAAAKPVADIGQVIRDFGGDLRQKLFAGNAANAIGDAIAKRVEERKQIENQREQVMDRLAKPLPGQPVSKTPTLDKPAGANSAVETGSAEFSRLINAGKKQASEDQVKKKHFETARKATEILGKMLDAMNNPDNGGVAFG